MHKKDITRVKRARRTRAKIAELGVHRLTVHRTPSHTYAQIILAGKTFAAASTIEKELMAGMKSPGNIDAAKKVGATLAERAKSAGITKVAFDRSGFQFHGRIKALAEAAREAGLEF